MVLAADCCYFARPLQGQAMPSFGHDLREQARTLEHLPRLRDGGATIVPGHDLAGY